MTILFVKVTKIDKLFAISEQIIQYAMKSLCNCGMA